MRQFSIGCAIRVKELKKLRSPIVNLVLVVTVDLVATYLDLEDGQELERWSITTWNNSFSLSRRRPAPLLFHQ